MQRAATKTSSHALGGWRRGGSTQGLGIGSSLQGDRVTSGIIICWPASCSFIRAAVPSTIDRSRLSATTADVNGAFCHWRREFEASDETRVQASDVSTIRKDQIETSTRGDTSSTSEIMPARRQRPGVYNTPSIRNGGFGALQVEAINNKPLSIARRHLAASTLRMRAIEPEELSSGEWVRFLVMDEEERERWITRYEARRRRNSDESTSSVEADSENAGNDKESEARQEAESAAREERRAVAGESSASSAAPTGTTPTISIWARAFDDEGHHPRRPQRNSRRAAGEGPIDAPPTYESALRSGTPPISVAPPPAYEPTSPPMSDDESRPTSPSAPPRRIRWAL